MEQKLRLAQLRADVRKLDEAAKPHYSDPNNQKLNWNAFRVIHYLLERMPLNEHPKDIVWLMIQRHIQAVFGDELKRDRQVPLKHNERTRLFESLGRWVHWLPQEQHQNQIESIERIGGKRKLLLLMKLRKILESLNIEAQKFKRYATRKPEPSEHGLFELYEKNAREHFPKGRKIQSVPVKIFEELITNIPHHQAETWEDVIAELERRKAEGKK